MVAIRSGVKSMCNSKLVASKYHLGVFICLVLVGCGGGGSDDDTTPTTNNPPVISGSPGTTVMTDQAYTFTPTANDADGDTLSFSIANQPSWANFSTVTGALSGTPDIGDVGEDANIVITVTDGIDSASLPTFSITVVSDNTAPTISGSPSGTVMSGESYSFTPTATDSDNDSLTFTISNPPNWAVFDSNTGALTGIPDTNDVGDHSNIEISVSDGIETASLPLFTITVTPLTAGSADLSWLAPTLNEDDSPLDDLAGFRIYYGTAMGGPYANSVTIANPSSTAYMFDNLTPGVTYYFVATAYDALGDESEYSNEATKTF